MKEDQLMEQLIPVHCKKGYKRNADIDYYNEISLNMNTTQLLKTFQMVRFYVLQAISPKIYLLSLSYIQFNFYALK